MISPLFYDNKYAFIPFIVTSQIVDTMICEKSDKPELELDSQLQITLICKEVNLMLNTKPAQRQMNRFKLIQCLKQQSDPT